MTEKPKTFEEVTELLFSGDIDIMLKEDVQDKGMYKVRFLICDHRRTYEEGEVYEVIV